MNLTKKQRAAIECALRNAERAHAYIHDPRIAVCRRDSQATTTLHYSRPDGALYEVERAYGSDLTGLDNAIAELRSLLGGQSGVTYEEHDGKLYRVHANGLCAKV